MEKIIKDVCDKSVLYKTSIILLSFSISTIGFARPPDHVRGTLVFLGVTNDSRESVWLSTTSPGSFRLEAQQSQLIDQWQKSQDGIRVSISPVVAEGNAGKHFLINAENNKTLDSEKQKGGVVFPPIPIDPPGIMPPIVLVPEHPIIIPPGQPPSVTHPIPPTVEHPIIIPPGQPPSVAHPIPPTPENPTVVPGGKNQTPPTHQHPTLPIRRLPIVAPPSGDSSSIKHPIIVALTQAFRHAAAATHSILPTIDHPIMLAANKTLKYPIQVTKVVQAGRTNRTGRTAQVTRTQTNTSNMAQQAPITEARRFDQNAIWNVWNDNRYFNINDGRHGLDSKGITTDYSIGADRRVKDDLVLGGLFTLVRYHNTAFDSDLTNHVNGFKIGPYFGYILSQNWTTDGTFVYGMLQNHNTLGSLNSAYTTQLVNATLRAIGVYKFGAFQLSPKPLISYTHFRNPAYQFNGTFRSRPVQINRAQESFNFGFVELRLEGNYEFKTQEGAFVQPYAEAGIDYAFAQPNDGQILTGNLTLATASPYTGTLTLGVRTLLSKAFLIDASGSYLSLGQNGLDVWGARLLFSYSFS